MIKLFYVGGVRPTQAIPHALQSKDPPQLYGFSQWPVQGKLSIILLNVHKKHNKQ